jgi:hypothetical protein
MSHSKYLKRHMDIRNAREQTLFIQVTRRYTEDFFLNMHNDRKYEECT